MTIYLPRPLADDLIARARAGKPNEVCGVVGLEGQRIARLEAAPNASSTPRVHFTFDGAGYRLIMEVERAGLEPGIFHSHPASAAYPSATDRREMSATWPDCLQLMISLRNDDTTGPEIFAYRIDGDGTVVAEDLRVVDER